MTTAKLTTCVATAYEVNTYVYDAANRQASFSGGGTATSYAYNGDGNRYRQTVGGVQTNYVLDLNMSLPQVLSSATSSLTTRYLLGLDVLGQQQGTQWSYFGYDGLELALTPSVRFTPIPGIFHLAIPENVFHKIGRERAGFASKNGVF